MDQWRQREREVVREKRSGTGYEDGSLQTKGARGSQREKIWVGLGGWISGDKGSER